MVNYATLSQVRDYGEYAADETADDAAIETLITQVSASFERMTGRIFTPDTDITQYFAYADHVDGYDLWIGDVDNPLLSITTLTNGDGTSIASTEYFLLPRNGSRYHTIRLKEASTVSWEDDTDGYIAITGRWGWSASVPDDVRLACIEAVLYIVKGRGNINDFERPKVASNGTVMLPKGYPKRVHDMLSYYTKKV